MSANFDTDAQSHTNASPVKMFITQLFVAVFLMGVGGAVIAANLPSASTDLADDGSATGVLFGIALVALGQVYALVYTIALGVYFGVKGAAQGTQTLRDPVSVVLQGIADAVTAVVESVARGLATVARAIGTAVRHLWGAWSGLRLRRKLMVLAGLVLLVALGGGAAAVLVAWNQHQAREMAIERAARFGCDQLTKQIPNQPSNEQYREYLTTLDAPVRQEMKAMCPKNYQLLQSHAASATN